MGRHVLRPPGWGCWRVLLLVGSLFRLCNAAELPRRFLFISSPTEGNVYYSRVPSAREMTAKAKHHVAHVAKILIDGQFSVCKGSKCNEDSDMGLKSPTGLALYQRLDAATLFIADAEAKNIYAYEISGGATDFEEPPSEFWGGPPRPYGPGDELMVGRQRRVAQGIDGLQGLAVDSEGNLFYAVSGGQINKIAAANIPATGHAKEADASEALYSTDDSELVSTPIALAADGYHLYWANQAGGQIPGSVVTATEQLPGQKAVEPRILAANGNGAFGVCLGRGNIFYSAETAAMFAVKTSGGAIAQVNGEFGQPRGCVFDSESTLYVADTAQNAIYSMPAVSNLRAVRTIKRVINVTAPDQVSIFRGTKYPLKGPIQDCYSAASQQNIGLIGLLLSIGLLAI
eukprot:TRINITY_DN29762_c0_g1_i1.p1 TRINITY_DN29762_c0_g1~~TRINITY_DN29762_c0_g1_i1.p1  ORF type:complete len:401 (-),score=63.76 TRINITY_DN29762_c0_g1_i1:184-1386(-)